MKTERKVKGWLIVCSSIPDNFHVNVYIYIINWLEQVSQFTYLCCSISYQFSNDVEFKLAKFLQLISTINRTIFKKMRTETILKIYNTLVLPTFLLRHKIGL